MTASLYPSCQWEGLQDLQDITGYKMKACKIASSNAPLPDELNASYAHFEQEVSESMPSTLEALDELVSGVTIADVRAAFLKVNPRKQLAQMGYPDVHSDPARISWRRYSQTSSTSLYNNLRSLSASKDGHHPGT